MIDLKNIDITDIRFNMTPETPVQISDVYWGNIHIWPDGTPPVPPVVHYNFSVSPTSLTMTYSAQTVTMNVTTNSPLWQAVSCPSWMNLESSVQVGGSWILTFSVEENEGDTRTGNVEFNYQSDSTGGTATVQVGVEQELAPPIVYYTLVYTSSNGQVINPVLTQGDFGANIVSNVYDEVGTITFDAPPTRIPVSAYSLNTNLKTINIPTSITEIGTNCFSGNTYLNIYYEGTFTQWQDVTISSGALETSATIHYAATRKLGADYVAYQSFTAGQPHQYMNFGIPLTTDTVIRFDCKLVGLNVGSLMIGCRFTTGDSDDFRWFITNGNIYFDWCSSRISGSASSMGQSTSSGATARYELSNYKMINLAASRSRSGTTQSRVPSPNAMLAINTNKWWIKSVEILQGGNTVLNLSACTCDGVAGFYDSVSDSFLTISGLTSSGGQADYSFTITPASSSMTYSAQTAIFTAVTDSPVWHVVSMPSWITSSASTQINSSTWALSFNIPENTGATRSGNIVLEYESIFGDMIQKTIPLTQAIHSYSFNINPSSVVIYNAAQAITFTAVTDSPLWQVTSMPSWITSSASTLVSTNTWVLSFDVPQNTGSTRSDYININYRSDTAGSTTSVQLSLTQKSQSIPNNEIHYVSTNGNIVTPSGNSFNASVVSNTYSGGYGVIVLSSALTRIEQNAFKGKTTLYSITIPDTTRYISSYVFSGCTSLTEVDLSSGLTGINSSVFDGCTSLKSIVFPNNTYSQFGTYNLKDCTSLSSVTLPNTITEMPGATFENCVSLSSVTIPSGVTIIGAYAFYNTAISSITLPSGLQEIKYEAFQNCASLLTIEIPSGVTVITRYLFGDDYSLSSVTIGSGVRKIEEFAFMNCTSLSNITYNGTKAQWASITKEDRWRENVPATVVHCTDGDAPL